MAEYYSYTTYTHIAISCSFSKSPKCCMEMGLYFNLQPSVFGTHPPIPYPLELSVNVCRFIMKFSPYIPHTDYRFAWCLRLGSGIMTNLCLYTCSHRMPHSSLLLRRNTRLIPLLSVPSISYQTQWTYSVNGNVRPNTHVNQVRKKWELAYLCMKRLIFSRKNSFGLFAICHKRRRLRTLLGAFCLLVLC